MSDTQTNVVLLSGGSGSRLWPLSNGARSKQFLKVLRTPDGAHESMVQRTVRLVREQVPAANLTIATSASQVDALALQLEQPYSLSVEPERRDTAPAIMLACAHVAWEQNANPNSAVVVIPIDSYVDPEYYSNVARIAKAVQAGAAELVLLGVEPTYPSEKYGYIVPASREAKTTDNVLTVARFTEKPREAAARELIEQGALWNCGVFAFRLGWLLDLISRYSDATSYEDLRSRYGELPKNSFDYEVVERATSVGVMPYSGAWKDLGTWNTLCEELAEPTTGRVWLDTATTSNIHAINETGLPIVIAGISDAVVTATPDGILVSGKEASANIKGLVEEATASRPMYERRQWGEYRVIHEGDYADGSHTLTKELVLLPGHQVSYQRHQHRAEIWTIANGEGDVVIDGEARHVRMGDSVHIAPMQMHACKAETELHIVEVQVGWPLVEDDIERFGFFWK